MVKKISHVHLTEKQFKLNLRKVLKLLSRAITYKKPFYFIDATDGIRTKVGGVFTTQGNGLKSLRFLMLQKFGVLESKGGFVYGWTPKKKKVFGTTLKEMTDVVYKWVKEYDRGIPKKSAHRPIPATGTPNSRSSKKLPKVEVVDDVRKQIVQDALTIVENNNRFLVLPKQRAALRMILRDVVSQNQNPLEALAAEELYKIFEEKKPVTVGDVKFLSDKPVTNG